MATLGVGSDPGLGVLVSIGCQALLAECPPGAAAVAPSRMSAPRPRIRDGSFRARKVQEGLLRVGRMRVRSLDKGDLQALAGMLPARGRMHIGQTAYLSPSTPYNPAVATDRQSPAFFYTFGFLFILAVSVRSLGFYFIEGHGLRWVAAALLSTFALLYSTERSPGGFRPSCTCTWPSRPGLR
jgi:hypothetical protein